MSECTSYLETVARSAHAAGENLEDIAALIYVTWGHRGTVWLCGNGGSAATAAHFAADLTKAALSPKLQMIRAFSLAERTSVITAIANDLSYDEIFSYQLRTLLSPNDLLICFSCSGNSVNILKAIKSAQEHDVRTTLFTGNCGGEIARTRQVDYLVKVPSSDICVQEDVHLLMCHALARRVASLISANVAPSLNPKESIATDRF
jgi:D-sedoheptulose 7-phosphate isomerase